MSEKQGTENQGNREAAKQGFRDTRNSEAVDHMNRLSRRLAAVELPELRLTLLLREDRQGGHGAQLLGFVDDDVEVVEDFSDGHGVDFAARVVAFFDELFR